MKKLLGILVLGLLLVSCSTTSEIMSKTNFKRGWSKAQVKGAFGFSNSPSDPFLGSCLKEYYPDTKREILAAKNREVFFVFENVTWPRKTCGYSDTGNGQLLLWTANYSEAKDVATKKTTTEKKTTKATSTTETNQNAEKKIVEAASGSAFFISNTGYIITNFHVIETCNDNSKIFYKNNEIDAKLIAKDEYLDLALLKVEVSNNKFITISNMAPRKLQRIIAAGYPFGKYLSDDMKFTSGIVSSLKGIKDDSTRLQIDAALNPGNSGGPIVDENTGKLVAVAVAGLRKDMTEAVNFGIKAGSVRNFLESNQIDITTFAKSYSRGEVAELLENTVLYTFCK